MEQAHHERVPQSSSVQRLERVRDERLVGHGQQGLGGACGSEGSQGFVLSPREHDGLKVEAWHFLLLIFCRGVNE